MLFYTPHLTASHRCSEFKCVRYITYLVTLRLKHAERSETERTIKHKAVKMESM